ncbi:MULTISPECIES: DMT family transporter [unclassified Paracoccus (in: a-proteobacteria)]|uniref:DMT family transporter n=1 Tax=unclassified Paracoccus (in: a-proteobacteria) TaxID=2688777 RepID=UPI0018A6B91B|nr:MULTISPECIES: DMT family transporter [unclassified Paracoccus (in: a-proteobacteria)]UXU73988.1 DMT family transporter [Paracoccus sp. SMMA_5]UXU79876.1 DMT family transporter [Paracoccus sp. SMMA_5_TC]
MTAVAPSTRQDIIGILWMLTAGLCFVAVNGTVRWLGQALPAAEGAFIRFAFGLLFLLPVLRPTQLRGFSPRIWRLFILRGALHVLAVILWFFAMARIPVAEVTAIGFLNPIVVTLGAALLMGERISWRRGLAILVALAGAMVVLRPGFRELAPGHLAQLGASVTFGASYLVAKRLSERVPASVVVAMMSLTVCIGLAPIAALNWVAPSLLQCATLACTAFFATAGHYAMTRAFASAPLQVTQPVTFLQLIWASLLGALVFAEPVDIWVLVGGAIMIGAISYITWREARLRRGPITPPPNATRD